MPELQMELFAGKQPCADEVHAALDEIYLGLMGIRCYDQSSHTLRSESVRAVFRMRRALENAGVRHSAAKTRGGAP